MRKQLQEILASIDISPRTWTNYASDADVSKQDQPPFDQWATADFTSLYYIFNTLPSPRPSPKTIDDRYSRVAAEALLLNSVTGLKTTLYRYQARSAAEMLQREIEPRKRLDPRLEVRQCPTGEKFYYNGRDHQFFRHPQYFDSPRGGILAESMGLGKTLICIALILATRGHVPSVPPQYDIDRIPVRPVVGSLSEVAAASLSRTPIPWRVYFENLRDREGLNMSECMRIMEKQKPEYEIPPTVFRQQRHSMTSSPAERRRLCSGTLVVVPKNLVHQWKSELARHVSEGALKVLVIEERGRQIPSADELAAFDLVLFSRPRFESENKGGEEFYESPLKKLHWLRIIIDEGHNISSMGTKAATVAESIVRAERRWVVSGTPARDLMGVEVDLAILKEIGGQEDMKKLRKSSLEQRRAFNKYQEASSGAVRAIGYLASGFLNVRPWAASANTYELSSDLARWEDYIYRHESLSMRTFDGFSRCLRQTLESLVVKNCPEEVERDIELPPLTHSIIRLQPSFYDKLTANLFVLQIVSNAVTSERQDMDYLFHRNSQHHLHRLISSLRQSSFYWTGLDEASVRSSLDVTTKYLAKGGTNCDDGDRALLTQTANTAKMALDSPVWKAVTQASEMGLFTRGWPDGTSKAWAFANCEEPMTIGLSQCAEAQRYVDERLAQDNPLDGFECAGQKLQETLELMNTRAAQQRDTSNTELHAGKKRRFSINTYGTEHGENLPACDIATMNNPKKALRLAPTINLNLTPKNKKSDVKQRLQLNGDSAVHVPAESTLGQAVVTGTTSAKFSYLIDRILAIYLTEKVLIFYDGNYVAYYLASILDLFHIKYLLYSNDISNEQRGKYLVLFNDDPAQRVMIMDIRQAAHGLNVCAASRVFFVNPVCRPNVEAQAIKRAHRIGQTKRVLVETLILKGTVEEEMFERSCRMTSHEHLQAKTLEDDLAVARIIQQARVLPIEPKDMEGDAHIAALATPQQIFGRPGRGKVMDTVLEKAVFGDKQDPAESTMPLKKRHVPESKQASTAGKSEGKDNGETAQIKAESSDDVPTQVSGGHGYISLFGGPT